MGKLASLATAGIAVSVLTGACSAEPPSAVACIDWVHFENPQDQFDQAGLVAVGKPVEQQGETNIYGYRARTHLVEVEAVLKGEPRQETLSITSIPQTCTGGVSYPDGDPLDTNQRVLIFATEQDGKWFTITPWQGVIPFSEGSPLPFESSYTTPREGEQRGWTPERMKSATPEPMPSVP